MNIPDQADPRIRGMTLEHPAASDHHLVGLPMVTGRGQGMNTWLQAGLVNGFQVAV